MPEESLDLIGFVTARLDDDEQAARACDQKIWHAGSAWAADLIDPLPSQRRDHPGYIPMITAEDVAHIARHDPARVLREAEAKRQRVDLAQQIASERGHPFWAYAGEQLLKLEAAPYADHPDYRAEWSSTDG